MHQKAFIDSHWRSINWRVALRILCFSVVTLLFRLVPRFCCSWLLGIGIETKARGKINGIFWGFSARFAKCGYTYRWLFRQEKLWPKVDQILKWINDNHKLHILLTICSDFQSSMLVITTLHKNCIVQIAQKIWERNRLVINERSLSRVMCLHYSICFVPNTT